MRYDAAMSLVQVYVWPLLAFCGGVVVAGVGGFKLYITDKNPTPVRMTYAQWVEAKPDREWLELEQVYLDWGATARIDTKRKGVVTDKEYFVAGWTGPDDDEPVRCFFVVHDPDKQHFMEQVWTAQEKNDDAWILQNANRLDEVTTIRGLVRTGIELSSEDEKILRDMADTAPDFKIVDIDAAPRAWEGWGFVLGGMVIMLVGVGLGVFTWRKETNTTAAPPILPPPAWPQPAPPYPVPPSAPPHQPPLGPPHV